jgi:hypothetical protein
LNQDYEVIFKGRLDRTEISNVTSKRAYVYALLVRVFGNIPNEDYLQKIRSHDFRYSLDDVYSDIPLLKPSIDRIRLFSSEGGHLEDSQIIKALFVDRRNIIIGLGNPESRETGLTPLNVKRDKDSPIINVTYFHLEAEEMPNENSSDILDQLCIELDYMTYLCRHEQEQWNKGNVALSTIVEETAFLRNDLSYSTGRFCDITKKYAKTDFYRGFLEFMEGFIRSDLSYLNNLSLKL